jgi:hypothetical protein
MKTLLFFNGDVSFSTLVENLTTHNKKKKKKT